jgi:UDP-glucose 4-epimerase
MYLKEDMADPFLPGRAQADGEYGWAKLMGELVLKAYYKQYGLKSVSCRLFTVYGERENETHAIIALIAKALVRMDPYVIWGNGQQDRNFTYVGDIVDGVVRAAEKIDDASAINIGTSEHIKIIEVVKKIFSYTSFKPRRLVFDTTKPVGVFSRAADLAKARKVLRWEPRVSFDEGLRRTIRWYSSVADREELKRRLHVLVTER